MDDLGRKERAMVIDEMPPFVAGEAAE